MAKRITSRENKKPAPADHASYCVLLAPALKALALGYSHENVLLAVLAEQRHALGLLVREDALEAFVPPADRAGKPPVCCWEYSTTSAFSWQYRHLAFSSE
jgi:hypothetical protein